MPAEDDPAARRCILCGERGALRTGRRLRYRDGSERAFALACPSCGLLSDLDLDTVEARRLIDLLLREQKFECRSEHMFGLDAYTLRTAASSERRGIVPLGPEQAAALSAPHRDVAAHAKLVDLAAFHGPAVAVGAICRPDEVESVNARLSMHASWARELILLIDGDAPASRPFSVDGFAPGTARRMTRPLAGDFAAQRNALQDACASPWVLQLDADETLPFETGALLPAFAAEAERDGVVSIGLPRRNLVDGVASDLYPDVQYRLNRREIRYVGHVHERPDRDWRRSMIALHGAIRHDLDRAHVLARSARYEALSLGRGRLEETDRLLTPYRA